MGGGLGDGGAAVAQKSTPPLPSEDSRDPGQIPDLTLSAGVCELVPLLSPTEAGD